MKRLVTLLTFLILTFHITAGASTIAKGSRAKAKHNRTKVQSGTAGEVEVDLFSGRKNPSWALSERQTRTVFRMLAGLPPAPASDFAEGLGYRGFRVRKVGTLSKLPHEFTVYKGIAYDGAHYYRDEGRRIEQWLLRSGKGHLDMGVYKVIEKEIGLPSK
jgi:hypothetical protein